MPGVSVEHVLGVVKGSVLGVTGGRTNLLRSPGPQKIESLLSIVCCCCWCNSVVGNLKGDGSLDDAGLMIEDVMEAVAGDLNLASKFNWRLTTLEGWGLLTKRNVSSLTGVTKGVVSGVASMAASGGDSRLSLAFVSVLAATFKR